MSCLHTYDRVVKNKLIIQEYKNIQTADRASKSFMNPLQFSSSDAAAVGPKAVMPTCGICIWFASKHNTEQPTPLITFVHYFTYLV